ncbi:GatB/YqeY domain-containing protein [Candidatus Uhrbacteria bacterium]|nr:GatB/YqeY domain-containing protein [Candidatus Uhrbacteria bacterium]
MTLSEQIHADTVAAMKAKDAATTSALRMLKTAIGNAEIEARGSGKSFDDAAALAVVKHHAKKLVEAIAEYRSGGRGDLVTAAEGELKIIERYLPTAMPEDDIRKAIATVRARLGDAAQIGPLMGAVMKELKGQADGTVVRKWVEEALRA